MKIKNVQTQSHTNAMQINAAVTLPFKFLAHLFATVIDLLLNLPAMNAVWRERRELETVNEKLIKDIGLSPDCVRKEMKRSYFDIPKDRKRSYRSASTRLYCKPF